MFTVEDIGDSVAVKDLAHTLSTLLIHNSWANDFFIKNSGAEWDLRHLPNDLSKALTRLVSKPFWTGGICP